MPESQGTIDYSSLALAIIPPSLAIIVELLNPLTDRVFERDVEKSIARYEIAPPNRDSLRDDLSKSMSAAVELAGLAPTLVSAVTSGFAVLPDFSNPMWPSVLYVGFFVVLLLVVLKAINGRTFLELADTAPFWWRMTGVKLIRVIVLTANIALIIFVAAAKWAILSGISKMLWNSGVKLMPG